MHEVELAKVRKSKLRINNLCKRTITELLTCSVVHHKELNWKNGILFCHEGLEFDKKVGFIHKKNQYILQQACFAKMSQFAHRITYKKLNISQVVFLPKKMLCDIVDFISHRDSNEYCSTRECNKTCYRKDLPLNDDELIYE